MPAQLALIIYLLFILWLFASDRKLRPMTSNALWIPLLWIMIIGSRPISLWLGSGIQIDSPADYIEGSPLDRNVFLLLIIAGLVVLLRRHLALGRVFSSNRWFFVFFLYCLISIIWSDYPFVSFKRWTKELGNVVMILVVLTEKNDVQAFKGMFTRYTNVAIPLSVLFVKYFPDIGRYYNRCTWTPEYCGITTNKNELGCVLVISSIFFVWDLIEMRTTGSGKTSKAEWFRRVVLLLMISWLIAETNSSTALVTIILGVGILLYMHRPTAISQIRYLGTFSIVTGFLILILYSMPGLLGVLVRIFGRNMTLTGRTDLWADLLKEPINPLFGTGFQSFWLGPGAQRMWEKYYFHPNQAHNGYLETYLNGGLVGVGLLIIMIISTGNKLKKELLLGSSGGILRFSFLYVAVFYNWTEAMFNKLSLVWIALIIAALSYQRSSTQDDIR